MNFKDTHTFDQRCKESNRVLSKYPDRIPIICEKIANKKNIPSIDKSKYLVPSDLTMGQFIYVIRKRLKLSAESGLFIFIDGTIPPTSALIANIYANYKDEDGFLYVRYSNENTFGKN